MFEINISHKSARIRRITLKSRMETRRPSPIASAFLLALITYSCVLPVDHPLSVRAPRAAARRAGELQLKMHASRTTAPRGCASSQKKGGGQWGRGEEEKREMRVMRNDGVDVDVKADDDDDDDDDDDNDDDDDSREPLTFEF